MGDGNHLLMTRDSDELLGIYLQDHFAGATAGSAMARRIAQSHADQEYGPQLERFADDVDADRDLLRHIMISVDAEPSAMKDTASSIGERLGRLKPNNRLVSRSPLSDLVEFEMMRLGVAGKLSCWRTLRTLAESDSRLSPTALEGLIERAEVQVDLLEFRLAPFDRLRLRIVCSAFRHDGSADRPPTRRFSVGCARARGRR